jgi:DNA helicase-2/ATP-dependent DNA helicase PcrA
MDRDSGEDVDSISIMTLHSAKGLEFDTVFLPGWEEGVFPNQRALDDNGRAGLEEERRLAHVGITRARKRALLYFATNRRMHGSWNSNIPSRFLDELPEAHVEVIESQNGFGGYHGYGSSRFDDASFGSDYTTPGWQRAQGRMRGAPSGNADQSSERGSRFDGSRSPASARGRGRESTGFGRGAPLTIEGELVAKSTGAASPFTVGDRVFHLKFGNGNVTVVDGNKLTVQFDKAGEKRVVDSFLERV